ncbi:glutathione peroxidase [Paenibacillus ginsengarvi]|uniref:Glutathione peroxidase n=1 Tax=Paenibacillus ginsengarvi TaxID=400777 RepID=A0A3B0CEX7_9BACL|nr:glutathione peroxidase [Paenibacillus ginsengarvi]RKN84203.1 glutathione peroxidase [Paenibacillus ginsengarvi]
MSVYDYQVNTITGEAAEWSAYRGKVLLIVNSASKCSYSRQFAGLQRLYERYAERGFAVLAFPCNQFNGKEPGSGSEAREYCLSQFGLTFPLFEKIEVKGPNAHPLFLFLTGQASFRGLNTDTAEGQNMQSFLLQNDPDLYADDGIKWNFTKFLIDRSGQVFGRYETTTEPIELEPVIESLL